MKNSLLLVIFIFAMSSTVAWAAQTDPERIIVLDPQTFIKTNQSIEGTEIIQLFKVTNDEITLVDAIKIDEKTVNFKPLIEYRKLTIEKKD